MRTLLETFEFVAAHLTTQGERCMMPRAKDSTLLCTYRGLSGSKCAVGCLISDEAYSASMEGNGARSLFGGRMAESHLGLLENLQHIHDNGDPKTWSARLDALRTSVRIGAFGDPHAPFEDLNLITPAKRYDEIA